jgi:error-prone DNA polymerase
MPPASPRDYIELRTRSAFSFLEACSNPEDLALAAAHLGHESLALADRDGVSGLPRFHRAARELGIRGLVGAEVGVERLDASPSSLASQRPDRLLLLVESPEGWRRLCRLLTLAHGRRDKGLEARDPRARERIGVRWSELEEFGGEWSVLLRGDERLRPKLLARASDVFGRQLSVDVSHLLDRRLERLGQRAAAMAEAHSVPVVATGDVRCATARERRLLDALVCLRERKTLATVGQLLPPNGEGFLHSREEMVRRFADHPEWIRQTRVIAERCEFTLKDLGYRFPEYPLRPGETQMSRLRELVRVGVRERYGERRDPRVSKQIAHELDIIEKLDLPGYFLIVEDIASFASRNRILCQGRGSAANSAVCYALGITAVDPVRMDLLFERFLSEERGEWPDIDIDFPSGDQREKVIQYVFEKYGRAGSAMTANVITYRIKMAVREMGKVLGMDPEAISRLSKLVARLDFPPPARGLSSSARGLSSSARGRSDGSDGRDDDAREDDAVQETRREFEARLREAKLDPESADVRHWTSLISAVQGLPRHLGQHSGGVVIAAGRLDEVVPIEPASMVDRRIVQWDKEDCADLGIIKIDLLGLGMLAALEESIPLIRRHEGVEVDLAKLPPDDPKTYAMMRRADTIGVFQIESRAQMATLPRLKPKTFYDLVVEIAIIRPGPIVGQMVHPYLNRRAGREPVVYPHESLRPILERTLGVPIFQEQLLRIAMTAAGFSGGEAEELRRAMGFKRSVERMGRIEERLRTGMRAQGFTKEAEDQIVLHISSFALYGFPESHSASFALIAYASAYLKRHHPAAFLVGLLRAQPMGFYSPATLVKDAQRHGVEVRPIDVLFSKPRADLEVGAKPKGPPAVRIGLDAVGRLKAHTATRIAEEREREPFEDLGDFVRRVAPDRDELDALAELGALARLRDTARTRRDALWQVAALERDPRSLFAGRAISRPTRSFAASPPEPESDAVHTSDASDASDASEASPLPALRPIEETLADYRLSGLTTGVHLMQHLRPSLEKRGILPASRLRETADGAYVRVAGHAIVRQRPGSAKGFCFVTLEDETGLSNAVLTPDASKRFRIPLHQASLLEVAGPLQRVDGVIHVRVRELLPLDLSRAAMPASHDYR